MSSFVKEKGLARWGAGVAAGAVMVGLLTGCAAGGDGLEAACERLMDSYGEVMESAELVSADAGWEAAKVHLEAAQESLEGVQDVAGPAGEFTQLRDELVDHSKEMLSAGLSGATDRSQVAGAKVQQVLLRMGKLCGWG